MAKIIARTWEWDGGQWVLVLDHVFYGPTLQRAREIMAAHAGTDAFFRGCTGSGRFRDIECHTEITEYARA